MRNKNNEKVKTSLINKILKDTKTIVKHCEIYKNYMKNSKGNIQFKLPNISSNRKLISTNRSDNIRIEDEFCKIDDGNNNDHQEKRNYYSTNKFIYESVDFRKSTMSSFNSLNTFLTSSSKKTLNFLASTSQSFSTERYSNSIENYINTSLQMYKNSKPLYSEIYSFLSSQLEMLTVHEIDTEHVQLIKNIKGEDKNYEMRMTFTSVKIEFKKCDFNGGENKTVFETYLPLAILPLIYMLNQESLQKYISFALKLKVNIVDTSLNHNAFMFLQKNMSEFKSFIKNKKSLINHKKNYQFPWLTPTTIYDVIISMPTVELHLIKPNVKIYKSLDTEMLFGLMMKGFMNWEYHVLEDMNKYIKFRAIVNRSFSKQNKYYNRILFLDNEKDLKPKESISESSPRFNFAYSKDDNTYTVFFTFHSAELIFQSEEFRTQMELNLKELKIIEKVKEIYGGNINIFIKKLMIIKPKIEKGDYEISLNKEFFSNFDIKMFEALKRDKDDPFNFFASSHQGTNMSIFMMNPTMKSLQISLNSKDKYKEDEVILKKELINKFINTDLSKWKFVLFENKDMFFSQPLKEIDLGKSNSICVRRSMTRKIVMKDQFKKSLI